MTVWGINRVSFLCAFAAALLMGFSGTGAAAEDKGRPLVFLHYWTDSLSGGVEEMVSVYNKTASTKVSAKPMEHELFKVGIVAMLESGSSPEFFSYWAGARTGALVEKGFLAPLDGLWEEAGLDRKFPPAIRSALSHGGKTYLLPLTQHYVGFFYNRKVFEKYGVTPPATWEEFKTLLEQLKAKGVTPLALGAREAWPAQFYFDYLLLRSAGYEYRERLMKGEAGYADPEVRRAFGLLKELTPYFANDPNNFDWSEAARMVSGQEAAMTLMGTWIIGFYEGQLGLKAGVDYDFFPFPVVDPRVESASLGPIDAIAVPKGPRSGEALKVLPYFAEDKPQEKMAAGSGALSPLSTLPASVYSPMKSLIKREVAQSRNWAFAYDLSTPPAKAAVGLNAFKRFLANSSDIDGFLRDLQQRMEAAR